MMEIFSGYNDADGVDYDYTTAAADDDNDADIISVKR